MAGKIESGGRVAIDSFYLWRLGRHACRLGEYRNSLMECIGFWRKTFVFFVEEKRQKK